MAWGVLFPTGMVLGVRTHPSSRAPQSIRLTVL
ncbi:MAG: hypothetical protein INR71_04070 [Terriglobus roseus]|nr:hypothetical protein [Terriglobus roseus]